MSIYDEHLHAVAIRQARRMDNGESESNIREYLERLEWKPEEIERIISIAKRHQNK